MKRFPFGDKRAKTIFRFLIAAVIICFFAFDALADEDDQTNLRVTRMEWRPDSSELRVNGNGAGKRRTVTIKDADTGAVLGDTISRRDGRWAFKKRKLPSAPCVILVESHGSDAVTAGYTQNVPDICVGTPSPGETLTGITVIGPDQVDENTKTQYVCEAQYSDGTSENVSDMSEWTVDPTEYATITGGALNALEVSGTQLVTISAAFEKNNELKKYSFPIVILDSAPEPPVLEGSHAEYITTYEGTQTCLECHTDEALAVHDSVHYQWRGDASEATGLADPVAGKLGGINDFCIYPDINWIGKLTNADGLEVDGGCAKCHVGLGAKPIADPTTAQLENIDCLICHSDSYKRKVEGSPGNFRFVPDTDNMTVSIHQAAADITLPTKDSCLNCHTKAGGGNNFKRGDIEEFHRNPTRDFDVHMASQSKGGAGLDCLDCHIALDHKIAGRGSDLRPRELPDQVACTNCHTPEHNEDIQKHTARVSCTVCHIPIFAKVAATDMDRDWSKPGVFVASKGLYEPDHVEGTNVEPEYRFFNGMSSFYQFGDPALPGANGRVSMSAPEGDIRDPAAKIFAFKRHLATQPVEPGGDGRLLPLKIGIFFQSGDIESAIAVGAGPQGVDWGYNGHEFADTERYMGLFHEVAPKEQALSCNDCHNGGNRLDFAALGYTPKETRNGRRLCASCHEDESNEWPEEYFKKVHAKHVTDKKLDCSKCHLFTKAN